MGKKAVPISKMEFPCSQILLHSCCSLCLEQPTITLHPFTWLPSLILVGIILQMSAFQDHQIKLVSHRNSLIINYFSSMTTIIK